VLWAHQGGGEPLRQMPLEITRCLCVSGAESAPPPPPVRCGLGRVVVVNTLWPNAKFATVVAGVVSCRLLVVDGVVVGTSAGATFDTSSHPSLGASTRLARLAALAAARRGRGLLFLFVTLTCLPLFLSEI
jgi:hypothetical protein